MDVLTRTKRATPARRLVLTLVIVCATVPAEALAATNWAVPVASTSKGQAGARTITAPAGVTASCTGVTTPIVVAWNSVPNAVSYTVYKSAGGGSYAAAATVLAPTTSWSYSPPGVLQTYTFKVSATVGTNWISALSAASPTRSVSGLLVCT